MGQTLGTRPDSGAIDRGIRITRAVALLAAAAVGLLALYWTHSRSVLYVLVLVLPLSAWAFWAARQRVRPRSGVGGNAVPVTLTVLGALLCVGASLLLADPFGFMLVSGRGAPPAMFYDWNRYTLMRGPTDSGGPPAVMPPGERPQPTIPGKVLPSGATCSVRTYLPASIRVGTTTAILGRSLPVMSWTRRGAPGYLFVYLPGERCWITYEKPITI